MTFKSEKGSQNWYLGMKFDPKLVIKWKYPGQFWIHLFQVMTFPCSTLSLNINAVLKASEPGGKCLSVFFFEDLFQL